MPSKLYLARSVRPGHSCPRPNDTLAAFKPPFCPNPNCRYHNPLTPNWPYKKAGFYHRQLQPQRIQRFTCLHCRRSFSSQTFSCSYWQKRPDIDPKLFTKTTGCMSNRQIARDLGVAPETINRHLARLGRHCMLFHTNMMRHSKPARHLVIDGFVSFELSQYFPFHHHLAVEKGTRLLPVLHRQRGPPQRDDEPAPETAAPGAGSHATAGPIRGLCAQDVQELLEVVIRGQPARVDRQRRSPGLSGGDQGTRRSDPSSGDLQPGAIVVTRNPLWEVNLLDLLIRHSSANHKRETIAWSKRRQGSAERLAVFLVWRNYMQGRREKSRGSPTPAMVRRMCAGKLRPEQILRRAVVRHPDPVAGALAAVLWAPGSDPGAEAAETARPAVRGVRQAEQRRGVDQLRQTHFRRHNSKNGVEPGGPPF